MMLRALWTWQRRSSYFNIDRDIPPPVVAGLSKSRSNNPTLKRLIGLAAPEQNCGS